MRTTPDTETRIEQAAAGILLSVDIALAGGITRSELARRVNISRQTLSNRLATPGKLTLDELRELELALDADMADALANGRWA